MNTRRCEPKARQSIYGLLQLLMKFRNDEVLLFVKLCKQDKLKKVVQNE